MVSLRAQGIGKAYRRYAQTSGRLREWIGLGPQHELIWVLRGVTFEVRRGEALGIVGANGAGKSTLLKVLAGTVRPTQGFYQVAGRVSALLELGIGFHPDFTGRQNVVMASHLLGISVELTAELMADIEEFAEIGDYIDQPVRTYSSGMQVRLAFSVATAVRPDLLIVDEALSVGDTYFQHKSFDRIRRFREQGTSLLFVSHMPGAIKTLCDRALLIDQGVVVRDGDPDSVLDYYNALVARQHAEHEIRQSESSAGVTSTRSGTSDAVIASIELLSAGKPVRALCAGDPVTVRIVVEARSALREVTVGFLVRDRLGNDVYGTNTFHLGLSRAGPEPGARLAIDFEIVRMDLGVGSYSLTAALHSGAAHTEGSFDWWDKAVVFQVVPGQRPHSIGTASLDVTARWLSEGEFEARSSCPALTSCPGHSPPRATT